MNNLTIGITGGIGSGKTTVSKIISENGYNVLIADDIARNVMTKDKYVISEIIREFGDECYNYESLNPDILAKKVFHNKEKIEKLNSIVHPPTINKIEQKIIYLKKTEKLIFVESALIFEAKMEYLFDYILLVTAEEDVRINRVLNRGIETSSEIKKRMSHQISEDHKKGKSDFIIENNYSVENLTDKTHFFLNLFKSII